jgi:hypothetical protein
MENYSYSMNMKILAAMSHVTEGGHVLANPLAVALAMAMAMALAMLWSVCAVEIASLPFQLLYIVYICGSVI